MTWLSRAVIVSLMVTSAIAAATVPTVQYREDRLTVHATEVPVTECVRALESATGADVRGRVPTEGTISIDLEAVPLHQGLGRLFGESNFAITYRSDGRPAAIELLGGPLPASVTHQATAPAAPGSNGATWPSDPASIQAVATLRSFLDRNPSVDLPQSLAKTIGARTVPFIALVKVAATNDDRTVRARAWRLSLRTIREDPELWGAFKTVVETAPEDSMRDFARHLLGANAEELTRQLVERSDADMRGPTQAMLASLEAQSRAGSNAAESR